MRIFLTGATGYIGHEVARVLAKAGHEVVGLVRSAERGGMLEAVGGRAVVGDMKEPAGWREAAAECEVLVHAAQEYTPEGVGADRTVIDTFLAIAKGGTVRQIVYSSGVWVLGQTGDGPVFEDATTEHPAALMAWRAGHERMVLAADSDALAVAVIRPGIVYGGAGGGIPASYFESAEKEGASVYVGNGRNRIPHIHYQDVADFYCAVIERRGRGVFHAVDGTAVQLEDVARAASEAAGKGGAVRSIPLDEARAKMGPRADCLALDQVVQSGRNVELGWTPRHPSFLAEVERAYREWKEGGG